MKYRVELEYYRPSGTRTSAFYTVDALSPGTAIKLAKQQALDDRVRRVHRWGVAKAGPLSDPPPFAAPPLIQNGEQITLSISGAVELPPGDDAILVSPSGQRLRISRKAIERQTGRRLAPPPPVVTVEYYSLYPNQYCYGAARPVATSQHGVDQLVQVRVTKHDGRIVSKEIV